MIPQAVYHEIAVAGFAQPGPGEITTANWIESRSVVIPANLHYLQTVLDRGEREAILLSLELSADLLLMDEKRGRRIAQSLGIPTIGLLGLLIAAKQQGTIEQVQPILDELITTARFWIARPLYDKVIETAGES